MGQDTFYEITRRSIPLVKNDGISLSWRDSVVNVRTDKGINFFEFSYNLGCLDKQLDIFEYSLTCPKNSPASRLCESEFINCEMKNYDYTEMLIDSSFWPHSAPLTQEMTNVSMSAWSPPYFYKGKSALAILNNIGGVAFVSERQHKWEILLDFSDIIRTSLKHNKTPSNFEQLKESVYIVETSSICWAPKLNPDNSCYFVTVQKNSVILFWHLFNDMKAPVFSGSIQCDMLEIKNILWIQRTNELFWLICADIGGQVKALQIQLDNNGYKLLHSHTLWEYKDRMIASYLSYTIINGKVVLFYSKHRHFIVQAVDENCNILSKYINNINDYRITDITNTLDEYYLATINVKLFKINFSLTDDNLTVDLIPVDIKDTFSTHELYSICFSKTSTLCALGMIDRKLLCRKETLKIDLIFLSTDSKLNSLVPMFLNNPTNKLTDYWDCIETLRYKINKTKKMPAMDYDALFAESSNDIYKLKLYLIILIFFVSMKKIARVCAEFTLPELSVEKVKDKILLMDAQSTIESLYKKYKRDGFLCSIEDESLHGCVNYLKLYSKKHKTETIIDNDTMSIVKSDIKYTCQSCDDDVLEDFTCKNGHLNMYCMLSFTPIEGNYLVCKCCYSTARTDMNIDRSLCVFCDLPLVRPD